jgi:uncharacterized protein (TIGR02284 family)
MDSTLERRMVVASLNRCIEACVDTERAYGVAAATVRDPKLKVLFQSRADERSEFVMGLQRAISQLGGWPENQGTATGAIRRRLSDLEHGLEPSHRDRRVIGSVLREERAAIATYDAALPEARVEGMPIDIRVMLREQRSAMQLASDDLDHRVHAVSFTSSTTRR